MKYSEITIEYLEQTCPGIKTNTKPPLHRVIPLNFLVYAAKHSKYKDDEIDETVIHILMSIFNSFVNYMPVSTIENNKNIDNAEKIIEHLENACTYANANMQLYKDIWRCKTYYLRQHILFITILPLKHIKSIFEILDTVFDN